MTSHPHNTACLVVRRSHSTPSADSRHREDHSRSHPDTCPHPCRPNTSRTLTATTSRSYSHRSRPLCVRRIFVAVSSSPHDMRAQPRPRATTYWRSGRRPANRRKTPAMWCELSTLLSINCDTHARTVNASNAAAVRVVTGCVAGHGHTQCKTRIRIRR